MPNILKASGINVLEENVFRIHDALPSLKVHKPPLHFADALDGGDAKTAPVVIEDVFTLAADELEPPGPDAEEAAEGPVNMAVLQRAHEEADALLQQAMQEAGQQRAALLAQAQAEAEQLRREAQLAGKQEAYTEAVRTLEELSAGIADTIARLEGDKAGFEAEYEDNLQWAAMEIASKVLAKKVDRNDAELTEMVHSAVQGVKNESWVRVEVAQDMTRLITRLADLLDSMQNVEISPIPAESGTVLIETPSGVVDASLKTQLENLRGYFQNAGI